MRLHLYTDGAARGNPGPAGAGLVLISEDGTVLHEGTRYLGELTNNQAEYSALRLGLEKALELGCREINIHLDSELVVRQIKGEYRLKNEGLKGYYRDVCKLLDEFVSYEIEHIRREKNHNADRLANQAIDEDLANVL